MTRHRNILLALTIALAATACEKNKPTTTTHKDGDGHEHKDGDGHEHKDGDGHEHKDGDGHKDEKKKD